MKTKKIEKNPLFIGRKREKAYISEISEASEAQILVVYGRRRCGKTELIEQCFRERNLLKFEGLEGRSDTHQIKHFLEQLAIYTGDTLLNHVNCESWKQVFEIVDKYCSKGKWTLYFEELQWMANYKDDLISDLKYAWDNYFKNNKEIVLILCGSAPSFIVNHVIKAKALYNRSLHKIHLKEFTLQETRSFLKPKELGLHELMDVYLTLGGIPEYLKYVRGKKSSSFLAICQESFTHNGFFVDEYEKIFTSSLGKNENYQKIIEFLAQKKTANREEIAAHLKMKSGGSLSLLLTDLVECEFVEKMLPLGAKPTSTLVRYTIRDAYLQFYFKFIQPQRKKIADEHFEKNPSAALSIENYRKWLGYAFERWCRKNAATIAAKLRFSAVNYDYGPYFKRGSLSEDEGTQIDLIFKRKDRVLTLCEIKYTQTPVDASVLREMERKIEFANLRESGFTLSKVLISAQGATKSLQDAGYFDALLKLEDLV